jgi:virginiamycin A acetyltransferase
VEFDNRNIVVYVISLTESSDDYFMNIFIKFYTKLPWLMRKLIDRMIASMDGGEFWSVQLRKLYNAAYRINIGQGSYGCFSTKVLYSGSVVGNYCSFAPNVYYLSSNHPYNQVSTHPMFYNANLGFVSDDIIEHIPLHVGHDVWIGQNVIITKGCHTIGNGSIVGAGSIVTKDVPPYAIVAGNPARLIRMRFDAETIQKLEKCRWYMLPPSILKKYINCIQDIDQFVKKIEDEE